MSSIARGNGHRPTKQCLFCSDSSENQRTRDMCFPKSKFSWWDSSLCLQWWSLAGLNPFRAFTLAISLSREGYHCGDSFAHILRCILRDPPPPSAGTRLRIFQPVVLLLFCFLSSTLPISSHSVLYSSTPPDRKLVGSCGSKSRTLSTLKRWAVFLLAIQRFALYCNFRKWYLPPTYSHIKLVNC